MTRRARVRHITVRTFTTLLTASLLAAPVALSAGGQQYPASPNREPLPIDTATDWSDRIPAHISVVDGAVELERDGVREAAEENVPLLAGDRLRTARGRVEVLFSDGSALALDHYTDLDLLSDSLVRVQAGRIRLAIARGAEPLSYRVDAAGTTTWLRSAGEYRLVVDNRSVEPDVFVSVLRGVAELESGGGRSLIRTGLEARASARAVPSLPYATNVAAWDDFDRWADEQQRYRSSARSAQYLPAELRHYGGAFDQYGGWEHEQGYGYVWYPTVAVGWRPYYDGGWSFYGSFGWTWVGGGRWTWPTHHYGRWGWKTGRWFWIPGHRWGPAWVSWASAPGYLGWCPLGYDNRPVWSISYINTYGGHGGYGWTVLPYHRFGPRVAVSRWAVAPNAIHLSGGRFTVHSNAPVRPAATARQVEPLRAPTYPSGRYAVPRSLSSGASISGRPGVDISADPSASSAVARGRVAATPGRPSNPVTQPSGPEDGNTERPSTVRSAGRPNSESSGTGEPSDRPTSIRSASPRARSDPNPQAPDSPAGGRVSPRTSPSAPTTGPSGSQSSGGGRARSRMSSSLTAPGAFSSERRAIGRQPRPVPYDASPALPTSPARTVGRVESSPRLASPTFERAPGFERSTPSRPARSMQTAPTRSPQAERSQPAGRTTAIPRGGGPAAAFESLGQARSRNAR